MLPPFVTIQPRAWPAAHQISKPELQAVAEFFKKLHQLPASKWGELGVRQWTDTIYRVRATNDMYVFFSKASDGSFVVEDFASQEMLDAFAAAMN